MSLIWFKTSWEQRGGSWGGPRQPTWKVLSQGVEESCREPQGGRLTARTGLGSGEKNWGLNPGHSTSLLQLRQVVLQAPDYMTRHPWTPQCSANCPPQSSSSSNIYLSSKLPTPRPSVHCPDSFSVLPPGVCLGTPPHPSLVCGVKGRVALGFKWSISG